MALVIACSACSGKNPIAPTPPVQTPTTPTPPADPQPPTSPPATPPPPTLKYTRYAAFGDSLTEGVISPLPTLMIKLDSPSAYPAILQGLLAQRYTSQSPTVLNRGKAGEQAVDGLPRFIDVLRQDAPEVTIVLEGFNDLSALGNKGITQAVGAVESMVKQARSRGVVVLLATLPPERPGAAKTLPSSIYNEFNRQIRGTASDEGATLIDLSAEISLGSIGADGVHLTEAGYQEMANVYFRHIQSLFERAPQQTSATTHATHAGTR